MALSEPNPTRLLSIIKPKHAPRRLSHRSEPRILFVIWRHHFSTSYDRYREDASRQDSASRALTFAVVCVIIRSCDYGTKDKQAIYRSKKTRWCFRLGSRFGRSRKGLRPSQAFIKIFLALLDRNLPNVLVPPLHHPISPTTPHPAHFTYTGRER